VLERTNPRRLTAFNPEGADVTEPGAKELSAGTLGELENAFALRNVLDPSWAVLPVALVDEDGHPKLLVQDHGGQRLEDVIGGPLEIREFLRLAVGLAVALGGLHQRGLIHKDIKPANLVVLPSTGQVWLTGFEHCSRVPRERQMPEPPDLIAGTLAYMAPEQTGRMNRSIDSRADLYACGVTLYQLLTGELPFSAAEPMEWVHCHIARQAPPPTQRRSGIPRALDAIVMKLLAKTAEDRYQTAAGLEADLRLCLAQWEARGQLDETFVPGAHDASERLLIPEKLYGREAAIGVLLRVFDEVLTEGTTELVLVSGYSGIGKSAVVHEVHKVLVPPRGLFASGKFDQYKRDIPYATIAQAFQDLVRGILAESDAEVGRWRDTLQEAIGPNAQLMVQLIPELGFIIGPQPPVPDLAPQDARNRFHRVFRRFVSAFARPERPLVLFLDDLQWLDAATLDLLEELATQPGVRHLLLVGAYRDNEVTPTHPLRRTLQSINQSGKKVHEIVLAALTEADLERFISDALHAKPPTAAPLARLIHEKTGGNPFFAIQFLTALTDERLLVFDPSTRAWRWDIEGVQAKRFTDNVVDLLATRLDRLPGATQEALRQFAFLGNRTTVGLLGAVFGRPVSEIHEALADGVRAGLVFRHEDSYAFIHDRVQEAAYSITPEGERPATHLQIGRALAAQADPLALEENLFEIVNQLDRGAALIHGQQERYQVAELNLLAGRRAKASTAYVSALAYFAAGRALLADDDWELQYELMMALELELAECEFLTGTAPQAEHRLASLDSRVRSLVDRAAVTRLRVTICSAQDLNDRAVELTLDFLRRIGIDWAAHPTRVEVMQEYERLLQRLGSRAIESLGDLPLITDPDRRATLDALTPALPVAILTDENLSCLLSCWMVNQSLEHGNSDGSCFAYSILARVLGPVFGNAAAGFEFGKLAFDLVEQPELGRYKARVVSVFAFLINPWNRHVGTSEPLARRAFQVAQETGDLTFAAYSTACLITIQLANGNPLKEMQAEAEQLLDFARKAKFGLVIEMLVSQIGLIRSLRGLTSGFGTFNDAELDEGQFEQHLKANPGLAMAACWHWVRKLQACYLAGDYSSALAAATNATTLMWTSAGFFEVAEVHYYAALAQAAAFDQAPAGERTKLIQAIAGHYQMLEAWTQTCPENFADRAALVGAEIARIEGRDMEAMRGYDRAIRSSHENGFPHNEAIADEVAARFYATRGFETISRTYLHNAHACYGRWGADGKVLQLERQHPHLYETAATLARPSAAGLPVEQLDLATVVKTSQAVSGQSGIERVLRTLMVVMLEHTGAERGLLVLRRGDELRIEAEASVAQEGVKVRLRRSMVNSSVLSEPVVQYVVRTQETVLLDDAQATNQFSVDGYFARQHCRSVLCMPMLRQAELIGLLYLENNLTPNVFTPARLSLLKLLASQAALSLESASVEEKEALLREVHHRVKNNLQLISSFLNLQAARIDDPAVAELFADSRNRVRSMALVHENLYRAGDFSRIPMADHIRSLCAQLSRAYNPVSQHTELVIQVSDLYLEMDRAVTCGLIINELVSNALKHAFPDARAGRVSVDLKPLDGERLVLVVSDDGVGLPSELDFERAESVGLQLVHDLTEQLHGTVVVRRDMGTTFTITFDDHAIDESEE
jgi:predicted ATPase/two-component sensor histidine kinase